MNQEVTNYKGHRIATVEDNFSYFIYWNDRLYFKAKNMFITEEVLRLIKNKIDYLEN